MDNVKIAIVEDEALIADHIAVCLEDLGHEVAGLFDEADALFDYLQTETPDLILLDINLAGSLDGVDIAGVINQRYQIPFIFLTSNSDQRTLDRVKHTNPAAFIVKPFKPDDLKTNIDLALHTSVSPATPVSDEEAFFLKEKHALVKVYYKDIAYAEAADNYTILHVDGKRHMLSSTLKVVEEKLVSHGFMRTHRSYLVNLSNITKVEPRAVYMGELELPLSEGHRTTLLEKLNLF